MTVQLLEVLTDVMLKIQVFCIWRRTTLQVAVEFSKDHGAFIFSGLSDS